MTVPRMRVFAGPNGSGKSTLKSVIEASLLGVYVNADEILTEFQSIGYLSLRQFQINPSKSRFLEYVRESPLMEKARLEGAAGLALELDEGMLHLSAKNVNAYTAAAVAGLLREELLLAGKSFTFETVMSSPDKVDLMHRARRAGFRVYLYYIATSNPEINISRVRNRVRSGGHNVPEDKIVTRYERSLDLLYSAIQQTNRAYIFDNSTDDQEKVWIAECTDGEDLVLKMNQVPAWFAEHVIDRSDSV